MEPPPNVNPPSYDEACCDVPQNNTHLSPPVYHPKIVKYEADLNGANRLATNRQK